MATINEKLAAIKQAKDNIKAAIINKGGEAGDKISEYAESIANIPEISNERNIGN